MHLNVYCTTVPLNVSLTYYITELHGFLYIYLISIGFMHASPKLYAEAPEFGPTPPLYF